MGNGCIEEELESALLEVVHDTLPHITSMGMKLKPSKCRSFSLLGGSPSVVPFHIGGSPVASIRDEEQKFLGKLLFFKGKSEETFAHIRDTFLEGINNIENAMVRNNTW